MVGLVDCGFEAVTVVGKARRASGEMVVDGVLYSAMILCCGETMKTEDYWSDKKVVDSLVDRWKEQLRNVLQEARHEPLPAPGF